MAGNPTFVDISQYQLRSGLPDGLFSNQKSQFGSILEDLRLEKSLYILWPFGIFLEIWDIL
jgi:hypothetical protein